MVTHRMKQPFVYYKLDNGDDLLADDNASDFNKSETPPKDDDDEMDFERDSDAFYDQLRSKKMADEKKHAASPKNDDDEKNFEDAKTLQTHL